MMAMRQGKWFGLDPKLLLAIVLTSLVGLAIGLSLSLSVDQRVELERLRRMNEELAIKNAELEKRMKENEATLANLRIRVEIVNCDRDGGVFDVGTLTCVFPRPKQDEQ